MFRSKQTKNTVGKQEQKEKKERCYKGASNCVDEQHGTNLKRKHRDNDL